MWLCVSKSPACNVTLPITIQLACNNNEVVNPLHQQLFRNLSTPLTFKDETQSAVYKESVRTAQ